MAEPIHITSVEEFEKLKASHKYLLLDFWAEWCPPCKAIGPLFAKLTNKHAVPDTLAFAKVDIEEIPEISKMYGITSLPSFLVLVDGEPQGVDLGAATLDRGAVVTDGKVGLIKGADPKSLTLLASKLEELAKEGKTEEAA